MPQEFYSNRRFGSYAKIKVGVLCGGESRERNISKRSGRAVHQALKRAGFSTLLIDPSQSQTFSQKLSRIDVAFIALHGHGGEDGKIQSVLEKQKIPYVGSEVAPSRQAFDKVKAKRIFQRCKIPTPSFIVIAGKSWKKRLARFPAPFFVKPVQEGSSIGAFAVEDFAKSAEKIKRAVKEHGRLLVEEQISGREFTVSVFGKKPLPVIELKPRRSFYDYRAKYTKGMTRYLVPAPISKGLAGKLQRLALQTHQALGLRDLSRVDFLLNAKKEPYVLEANSIPGFTELSLFPKAAKAVGISFESLCTRLIQRAMKRGKKTYAKKKAF